jgi:hypothetical protein
MTFVHDPDISEIIDLEIVDVVPPEPSWLSLMVRRLEASGIFGDLSIRFKENMKDLRQFEGERTVFPCSSSGLEGKCLDSDIITEDGSLLVGCEISRNSSNQGSLALNMISLTFALSVLIFTRRKAPL